MWFSRLALIFALCVPAFGGYASKGTITFTGASGSTQTGITLAFSFSDIKMATVANGGQIQHLCSRNGVNVPCDFGVTVSAADCASGTLTGSYTWGFDGNYSATAGTGNGWILIASYLTTGIVPVVCVGNTAITTYQGGAVGAEFDANTYAVQHYADGTTLSVVDYSSKACNGVATSVTATTGKIDGGGSFGSSSTNKLGGTTCGANGGGTLGTLDFGTFTYEAWVNTATANGDIYNSGAGGMPQFAISSSNLILANANTAVIATSTGTIATGSFKHVAITWDNTLGSYVFYINGAASGSGTVSVPWTPATWGFTNHTWQFGFFNTAPSMVIDEGRISNKVRLADWIATEFANQNAPPVMSALTAVGGGPCTLALLGVGC